MIGGEQMERVWKRIENFSNYEVSNDGRVRNVTTGKNINACIRNNKNCDYYGVVIVSDDGNSKHKSIHRLVAEAFIENPNGKPCVNHKDGDKHNNCVENLEWVTRSENDNHAFRIGLRRSTAEQIQKAIDSTRKPVRNKTTGEVFPSLTAAAKAANGKIIGIHKCVVGERMRYKGMEFEFLRCGGGEMDGEQSLR